MGTLHVGTSGWVYAHWKGVFYAPDLPARRWLPHYARFFDSVELNATFYRLPRPGNAAGWAGAVPAGFRFAVKGSRYLTHMRKLLDRGPGVAKFFDAVADLGPRTGPVLWQLPPRMKADAPRLRDFLDALPTGRYAVEFREPEWLCEPVLQVIHDAGAALVVHDLVDVKWPWPPPGGFVYLRFHGRGARYGGRYGRRALSPWARKLLADRRERWVFFNNDLGGAAIHDALDLRDLTGLGWPAWSRRAENANEIEAFRAETGLGA